MFRRKESFFLRLRHVLLYNSTSVQERISTRMVYKNGPLRELQSPKRANSSCAYKNRVNEKVNSSDVISDIIKVQYMYSLCKCFFVQYMTQKGNTGERRFHVAAKLVFKWRSCSVCDNEKSCGQLFFSFRQKYRNMLLFVGGSRTQC